MTSAPQSLKTMDRDKNGQFVKGYQSLVKPRKKIIKICPNYREKFITVPSINQKHCSMKCRPLNLQNGNGHWN